MLHSLFVGYLGSVHVISECSNYQNYKWSGNPEEFPVDCYILRDAAYKLRENVIVPYQDNGHLTAKQKNFNFCHSSGRIIIERASGLFKTRFRSLRTVLAMNRLDLVPKFVITCCTLHNICFLKEDKIELDTTDEIEGNIPFCRNVAQLKQTGVTKKDVICEILPMRNVENDHILINIATL